MYRQLSNNLIIFNLKNDKLLRIGSKHDGGYIVSNEASKKTQTLISFGIEDNSEFEREFIEKFNIQDAYLYDHTVEKKNIKSKELRKFFFKKGLSHSKKKNFLTLDNIINDNKINEATLKIDIEFNEWEIFNNLDESIFKKFQQILVEFHFIFFDQNNLNKDRYSDYFYGFYTQNFKLINKILMDYYSKILSKLNKHFYIFHLSANNSLPFFYFNKKIKIPPLLELSLINKKNVNYKPTVYNKVLPKKNLDSPNKYYKEDLLNFYPILR